MTLTTPLILSGAPGSPYTRKMISVLRYRHIPYRFLLSGHGVPQDLPKPKVALLPTFFLSEDGAPYEAAVDSTPLIRRFERAFEGRHVVPTDPVIEFIDYLLEDYADEWLTKAMFHYRWHYKADIGRAAAILPRWRGITGSEDEAVKMGEIFAQRQISRLYVVGSNDTTAPVIESSYLRYLDALKAHLEKQPFLMGQRPGGSDFGAFGQLTEVGRVYVPALLANAEALIAGAEKVETEIDGKPWVQQPFPYQGKCLQWLREKHAALAPADRKAVDDVLSGTGCEKLFRS